MKRGAIAIAIGLVVLAAVLWKCRGTDKPVPVSRDGGTSGSAIAPHRRVDPFTLARGSITGTIRDERKAPIAGAMVCGDFFSADLTSEQTRDPVCAMSGRDGRYRLGDLVAATYSIDASARGFLPATHGGEDGDVLLAPGETKDGIDVTLGSGAVEVKGTVSDISGGPVGKARVRAIARAISPRSQAFADTDEQGHYSLWVRPGNVEVHAVADGYAETDEEGTAPATIDLLLTPESSLAGIVLDGATGEPRAGVRVRITAQENYRRDPGGTVVSDADGKFRITRLVPSRYEALVQDEAGYGRSERSLLVGLGQHVDGMIVRVFRAYRVAGSVVVAGTDERCQAPFGYLEAAAAAEVAANAIGRPDGTLVADGVLPGTYTVRAGCPGYQPDGDPRVVVVGADVLDQRWSVRPGGTVTGRVVSAAGSPVAGAEVEIRATTPVPRGGIAQMESTTQLDGSFELRGLAAGHHRITVATTRGQVEPVELDIAVGQKLEKQIVLADGGTIRGIVVDTTGAPQPRVQVFATPMARNHDWSFQQWFTHDDGRFEITGLPDGVYGVYVTRGETRLRVSATRVEVSAAKPADIRIVVEDQHGVIRGSVVDASGAPVGDAYVSAAREEEDDAPAAARIRWSWDTRPRVTAVDGTFTIDQLAPGNYTVIAFRKGGGEAVAEHVPTGGSAKLQFRATAVIEGVAKLPGGRAPDGFRVTLSSDEGYRRFEQFYGTQGKFAFSEVTAGTFELRAESPTATGRLAGVTVAAGERKTGVEIALEPLATVTGTLVDRITKQPIRDVAMFVFERDVIMFSTADSPVETPNVTDAAGRFTIRGAKTGRVIVYAQSRAGVPPWSALVGRTLPAEDKIELHEVAIVRPRLGQEQPAGKSGITFERSTSAWFPSATVTAVAAPAATTGLRAGDTITSIDGVGVAGDDVVYLLPMLRAPAGTTLELGLARGGTVRVTLN